MTAPVSHKLHIRPDGHMFVISGNPSIGYHCHHVALDHVSDHKRSWQAVQAAGEWSESFVARIVREQIAARDAEAEAEVPSASSGDQCGAGDGPRSWGFQ